MPNRTPGPSAGRFIQWLASLAHARGRTGRTCAMRGALVGLLVGALLLGLWAVGVLHPIEWYTFDTRQVVRYIVSPSPEPPPVTVVAIDDRAVAAFGRWPWPRAVQAEVIHSILAENPAVLGIDVVYSTPSEDFRGDQRLAQSLRSETPVVLAAATASELEQLPLLALLAPNVFTGHIDAPADFDGVVRSVPDLVSTSMGDVRALSWEMAHRLTGASPQGAAVPGIDVDRNLWISYRPSGDGTHLSVRGIAETVSVVDVIEGRAGEMLRGRPVLLGVTSSGLDSMDRHLTSLRPLGQIPGVYLHAALLSAMMRDDHIRPQALWQIVVMLVVGGTFVGTALFLLRPWPATLLFASMVLGLLGVSVWRFAAFGEWIVVTPSIGVLALTYVAGLWHAHVEVEREVRQVRETFRRYVAPEVVDALLAQPSVAEMTGGRRPVTVMFADIRGFTTFAEQTPPEEVVKHLNRYLELMSESVLLHGGMVDKFVGDGVMALFGAPLPIANHSEAAVRAGQHLLRRIESAAHAEDWVDLSVGIGIHSGEAVVGSIGSVVRLEYTAIGDAVNVASRLQEIAAPGSLVVSDAAFDLLPQDLAAGGRALDPVSVRGRVGLVHAYQFDASTRGRNPE